ncbi:hypothetical protein [Flavobacterium sp. 3HN19-14]|uniref:hypothetical protein n=1 Tax=Flavobacterium sp. 3HN19-14 TaxID=3448133 RepID=UPI003EE39330
MKKIFNVIALIVFLGFNANAQDFQKVDGLVKTYPKSFSSPDDLAIRINEDFTRDDEKVRAIYTWMALNIAYDAETFFNQGGVRNASDLPTGHNLKKNKSNANLNTNSPEKRCAQNWQFVRDMRCFLKTFASGLTSNVN